MLWEGVLALHEAMIISRRVAAVSALFLVTVLGVLALPLGIGWGDIAHEKWALVLCAMAVLGSLVAAVACFLVGICDGFHPHDVTLDERSHPLFYSVLSTTCKKNRVVKSISSYCSHRGGTLNKVLASTGTISGVAALVAGVELWNLETISDAVLALNSIAGIGLIILAWCETGAAMGGCVGKLQDFLHSFGALMFVVCGLSTSVLGCDLSVAAIVSTSVAGFSFLVFLVASFLSGSYFCTPSEKFRIKMEETHEREGFRVAKSLLFVVTETIALLGAILTVVVFWLSKAAVPGFRCESDAAFWVPLSIPILTSIVMVILSRFPQSSQ